MGNFCLDPFFLFLSVHFCVRHTVNTQFYMASDYFVNKFEDFQNTAKVKKEKWRQRKRATTSEFDIKRKRNIKKKIQKNNKKKTFETLTVAR